MAESQNSLNGRMREYFADVADVDAESYSTNTCIRLGLEKLGYTGSINKMLGDWARANFSGTAYSLNTALRAFFAEDMTGEVGSNINTLARQFFAGVGPGESVTWDKMLTSWDAEYRAWENIG